MQYKTIIWKQASALLEKLDTEYPEKAIEQLHQQSDLDPQVKAAVIKLLELSTDDEVFEGVNQVPFNSIRSIKPGTVLDHYELKEVIGEGGMATVFRAKRIDSEVQKDVAIKVFNHNYLPSRLLHQFAIEQAIMARLDHENLVSLHHNGMTEDGTAFIVMDYVQQAKTLDDYVRQLELQPQDQAALIINIAEGLSHAHANLVVHRDIKPSNILVNNNGVIKIVDFGIAKLLDQQHEIDASATLVALTPHYAAPEQILDNRVSVQSDIYSLAAVFLGLLIGKKPLPDDRLLKQCSTDEAVIREHLLYLNADQDLKNILNKALQTDPAKRYNTMQAFADELKNWLQQKPVQATPDSWWYRLKKFAERRIALTATIITLFISLIAGVSAILWQMQETQKAAAKANSIKDFMLSTYAVVDPDVSQGRDIKARELLLSSYGQLNNNQQMDQELRFELMQNMGIASARIGAYEQALEMMRKSLEIKPNDSTSRTYLLQLLVANGELSEAEQWLSDHPLHGILTQADQQRLLRAKLLMYSKLGKFETTKNIADELMALPAKGEQAIRNNMAVAELYFSESKPDQAVRLLEQTLAVHNGKLADSHTAMMKLRYSLSSMYGTIGEPQKAHDTLQELRHVQAEILGENHPSYVTTLVALASANRALGNMPQAIEYAQQAYDLSVLNRGENHLDSANALQMMGALTAVSGDYPKAIELMKEAVRIFELNSGQNNPNALDIKTDIGMLMGRLGDTDASIEMLEEVHEKQLENLGAGHRSTIYVQMHLGLTHSLMGHHELAIELEKDALSAANEHLGEKHPISVNTLYALGRVYKAAGEFQLAVDTMLNIEKKELLNPNDEKMAPYTKMVSSIYRTLEQMNEAESYARRSVQLNDQIYGADSKSKAEAQLFLADLLQTVGKHSEVNELLGLVEDSIGQNGWHGSSLEEELLRIKDLNQLD